MDINLEQNKLGELLVDRDVISTEELEHALQFQENMGGKLGEILVQLDFVSEEQVIEAVADQQNMEIVDLSHLILPQDLIDEVPRELIEEHKVLPIGQIGDSLRLAIHDPFDIESIEEVGLATDFHIEPVLAPRKDILKAIDNLFYEDGEDRLNSDQEVSDEGTAESSSSETEQELNLDDYSSDELVRSMAWLLIEKGVFSKEELNGVLSE